MVLRDGVSRRTDAHAADGAARTAIARGAPGYPRADLSRDRPGARREDQPPRSQVRQCTRAASHGARLPDGSAPKLLDFGIAKLLDAPSITRPGATPGTTAHMAPEQLRGDPVDKRCDVYALGVLAYQMITGGLPYDAPEKTLYHAQMT